MPNPRVTVLMSAFNAQPFLREAVDSVLSQTFSDFEFIVFEDRSLDATLSILQGYSDARLLIVPNPENRGLTRNLAKGMKMARGKYIARMDADDVCLPHRLQTQVDYLEQHPEISVAGSAVIFFDGNGYEFIGYQPEHHDAIKCELLYSFTMLHPSVMMRKDDLARLGLNYDPHFICSQDHDLWVRASRELRLANVRQPLVKMREHPRKIGRAAKLKQQDCSDEIRRRQLDALNVYYHEAELNAFNQLANARPPADEGSLRNYESMLLKIFACNRQVKIFNQEVLEKMGAAKLRGWCRAALLNNQKWGRYYWQSPIRKIDQCSLRERTGMLWRSISC